MAEFDLRMIEKRPEHKAGLAIMMLLFPVWGLAIPGIVVLYIVLLLKLPANVNIAAALGFLACLSLITMGSGLLAFLFEDKLIRISKQGLCFPLAYLSSMNFRLQRSWDDLARIKLNWKRGETFQNDEHLTLFFKSGGNAVLQLKRFEKDELEQFLIAFESCASNCVRDAELDDFEYALQSGNRGELASYTQIWEKSLANKFSGATFAPLEPGSKIQEGRYHILRQLGFGGFAAVYLARSHDGRNIVLKESVFPDNEEVTSKAEELFRREASLLSKLNHKNLARVYDYFIENGRHYMSLEYLEGVDLGRVILRDGRQSEEMVLQWASDLAETLAYLHGQASPIVHRDLSPENILLRSNESIALIDFGAAKEIAGTFTGTIIGKQAYIAPEQFRAKPSPKSDIYSLGKSLHYLLTAKLPEALSVSSPRSLGVSISEEFDELIRRCTHEEEDKRPNSRELLLEIETLKKSRAPAVSEA
ncbi:MAG: serine/threonine protein kinase [Candidatus Obscuribacterales bacterium]|nr:serine/threonine protein kinase [Candidatus Obscuribacterales bacterium]